MKRNPQEHNCSDAAHQQCICEQESKRRIACPVFFSPHLAMSNFTSQAVVKPTQLHRPAIFFQSFKDPSSHQPAKPFRKFKIALTSRSCGSSGGSLRSYYQPDRFWNSCSLLRSKIFCTARLRAAIILEGSEVPTCVLAAAGDHQTGVTSLSTTLLRVKAFQNASDLACKR